MFLVSDRVYAYLLSVANGDGTYLWDGNDFSRSWGLVNTSMGVMRRILLPCLSGKEGKLWSTMKSVGDEKSDWHSVDSGTDGSDTSVIDVYYVHRDVGGWDSKW